MPRGLSWSLAVPRPPEPRPAPPAPPLGFSLSKLVGASALTVALFPKAVDQGERAGKLLTQRCSRLSLILGSGKLSRSVGQLGVQVIDSVPQCVGAGTLGVPALPRPGRPAPAHRRSRVLRDPP